MLTLIDCMSAFRVRLENRERHICQGIVNMATPTTIFVWDSSGGNDRRRAIYPNYKNRPSAPSNMLQGLSMIRELLSHTSAMQAWLHGFEGDDIIAALVERFPVRRIETGDGDLAALGVPLSRATKIPADQVRLYKTFVGDPSDTIKGVKGFGKLGWEAADKVALAALLNNILADRGWADDLAIQAGLSKASINWLRENEDEVRAMWTIINPFPMTTDQLNASLRPGVDNPAARDKIMKEFML